MSRSPLILTITSLVSPQELFTMAADAVQSDPQVLVAGREGDPDEAVAARPEGDARHGRYRLCHKQVFAEGQRVHSGPADVDERIERAARHDRQKTGPTEELNDDV